MEFPVDKKGMISVLAFFSWFLGSCPKLSEPLALLRDLVKKNVRWKPMEQHLLAFSEAKWRLLNEETGILRNATESLEDSIIIWTDASQSTWLV